MKNETVRKMSAERPGKSDPAMGQKPAQKTEASVGQITKGSGDTRANMTTSTNYPKGEVPKDFLNRLGEMHAAEKELVAAMPDLAKAAQSKDLKALLQLHLKETKAHVTTLERVADSLGADLPKKSCQPVKDLVKEAKKAIGKHDASPERDQVVMEMGQRVEQFEIDAYEPLCARAKEMEYTHERAMLTSILNQEVLANELLAGLKAGKGPLGKLLPKASLKAATGKVRR